MEHIHKLMRHYLGVEKTSLPIYAKTRALGRETSHGKTMRTRAFREIINVVQIY
jgi:hypothetical protein